MKVEVTLVSVHGSIEKVGLQWINGLRGACLPRPLYFGSPTSKQTSA